MKFSVFGCSIILNGLSGNPFLACVRAFIFTFGRNLEVDVRLFLVGIRQQDIKGLFIGATKFPCGSLSFNGKSFTCTGCGLKALQGKMVALKTSLVSTQKGYAMLKRKSDGLKYKLHQLIEQKKRLQRLCNGELKDAMMTLAMIKFCGLTFHEIVTQKPTRTQITIETSHTNIVGVTLPYFEYNQEGKQYTLTGLGRGGEYVARARLQFQKVTQLLVNLASMDYACKVIENIIKATNRKMNAMQFVIIPRIQNTIAYIADVLEERDREELSRIKLNKTKRSSSKHFSSFSHSKTVFSSGICSPENEEEDVLF